MLLNPFRFGPTVQDEYFTNVTLLLHANGTNGSITTVDSSNSAKTISRIGGPVLSTAQAKFGNASLLFTNGGDAFTAPSSSDFDFGTGDFTIECWIYPTTSDTSIDRGLIVRDSIGGTRGWLLYIANSTGHLNFAAWGDYPTAVCSSTVIPTINTWSFIQVVRESGAFILYLNGSSIASDSSKLSLNIGSSGTPLCIGSLYGVSSPTLTTFIGHIDDVRVTKGIARPVAIPTLEFPNS